jgi:hypothetical protein
MSELAPPLTDPERYLRRVEAIVRASQAITSLQSQVRMEIAALALEDTAFGHRRFVGDELALALRLSPWTGARLVEEAERFVAFPSVLARVADGTWSLAHADAVLDEVAASGLGEHDQQTVLALVVSREEAITPHQLKGAVRAAIMLLDLQEACRRREQAVTGRDVRGWTAANGASGATVTGPTELIAALMASLDALTWPKAVGDTRTAAQRRFDALMDLVCGRRQPGQWQAQVIVALSTLEGDDSQLAEIPGFGAVLPSVARDLVRAAGLRRVVVDEAGRLVHVDSQVAQPDQAAQAAAAARAPRTPGVSDQTEPADVDVTASEDAATAQELAELDAMVPARPVDQDDQLDLLEVWELECEEHYDDVVAELAGAQESLPTDAERQWDLHEVDRTQAYAVHDAAIDLARDLAAHAASARARREQASASSSSSSAASSSSAERPAPSAAPAPAAEGSEVPVAAWSEAGLADALQAMRTTPLTPVELSTERYAIPVPVARWFRLRDVPARSGAARAPPRSATGTTSSPGRSAVPRWATSPPSASTTTSPSTPSSACSGSLTAPCGGPPPPVGPTTEDLGRSCAAGRPPSPEAHPVLRATSLPEGSPSAPLARLHPRAGSPSEALSASSQRALEGSAVLEHPPSPAHPPGDRPQQLVPLQRRPAAEHPLVRGSGEVTADPSVDALLRSGAHRHLDHPVDHPGPPRPVQPVAVAEQPQLSRTTCQRQQPLRLRHVVVVQLAVQPRRLGDVPLAPHRPDAVPVEQGDRQPVGGGEDVPGRRVAVPQDQVGGGQFPSPPGHPGPRCQLEPEQCVVHPAQHRAHGVDALVRPLGDRGPVDPGQHHPAVPCEAQ